MLRRRIMISVAGAGGEFVDLGLPSGLLWAKGNIISDGNGGYMVGEETDYGAYVSWGNIVPHFSANGSTFDDGYDFGTSNSGLYASTPGASVSANIPTNDAQHDAALALLGSPWHLPTKEQIKELYDNTDTEWVADYKGSGVAGRKFMKKTDHSVYVFFPAAGMGYSTSLYSRGSNGYYWSGSLVSGGNSFILTFSDYTLNPNTPTNRYRGCTVRPVTLPFSQLSLHFQDGSGVALAGIGVTVTDGNGAHSMTTDASGNIVMNVLKGNVTLSSDAYSFDITTINVSGDTSTVITGTEIDFSTRYLTFEAIESGTFAFTNSLSYSTNNGSTWVSLAANTFTPTVSAGNKIMFKATLTPLSGSGIGKFSSTGRFNASGNAMSLLYGDSFVGEINLKGKNDAFRRLFYNCTNLVNAENLALPATTLADFCYYDMFYSCTSLTTAPQLPATTLADFCYQGMFFGCTSLTNVPNLPATTLVFQGYYYMFYGCTGLTSIPSDLLPATTLADYCYCGMFRDCKGLTLIPSTLLRATILVESCYKSMFSGCSEIIVAPDLLATTLASSCYYYMFENCTKLNSIRMLATDISATDCLTDWVYGVAASGTFYKKSGVTIPTGMSGIPSGWTVVNE